MRVWRTHRSGRRMYTARECAHRTLYSAHEYRKRWFCAITWCFYFFHYSIFVLWVFVFFFFFFAERKHRGNRLSGLPVSGCPPPPAENLASAPCTRSETAMRGRENETEKARVSPYRVCAGRAIIFGLPSKRPWNDTVSKVFEEKVALAREVNNGRRADQTIGVLGIFLARHSFYQLIVVSVLVLI